MGDDYQRRSEIHEAAHSVVIHLCGFTPGPVTARPGSTLGGCSRYRAPKVPAAVMATLDPCLPFTLWPAGIRYRFEADSMIAMSGHLAVLLLTRPGSGSQPDLVSERAAERVAELIETLPAASEDDRTWAAAVVDAPGHETDDERIARTAWAVHGRDLASASSWLGFCEAQTRTLIGTQAAKIERLADVLAVEGVLSGEAVAALVREPGDAADH